MEEKHLRKIERAWGILYPPKYEQFYYLRKRKVSFRMSSIGKLLFFKPIERQQYFSSKTNPALFNIEKHAKGNDIVIVIKRKSDIVVLANGEEIINTITVKNGRCDIVIPKYSLHFVFEAFVDVSADRTLKGIGNNYRIINQVGKGGFGVVFKGFKADDQTFCAIKAEKKTDKSRLNDEFDIVGSILHPNIILCLDFIQNDGFVYLVTELAYGGSLRSKIDREGPLPEKQSKHIYKQIFSGLEHLHSLEIIHRDIKPANIVLMSLDEFCNAKLIDFGISCFIFELKECRRVAGTTKYMAPEMLRNVAEVRKQRYNEKVDIWGMGISLFVTLTGQMPFNFTGDAVKYRKTILRRDMRTELPLYQQLSDAAKLFISKCLTTNTVQRASATDLLKDFWLESIWKSNDDVMTEGTTNQ